MQRLVDLEMWLNHGISENPLMLHGTGIETILELVKTGRLPSGANECKGRLYFAPAYDAFTNRKGFKGLTSSRKNPLEEASGYAKIAAEEFYLANLLNCQTAGEYEVIAIAYVHGYCSLLGWRRELKKIGIEMSLEEVTKLAHNASERRGVIIEPKESILQMNCFVPADDNFAIAVECPDGLDKKHIKGIKPLGQIEDTLIRRLSRGELDYKGFGR